MKTKFAFSLLCILSFLIASCGAVIPFTPTQSPTVTHTATITPEPTLNAIQQATETQTAAPTPTVTSTLIPLPEPDAKAMIAWKELGFSEKFQAFSPSNMDIQEGENAFTLSNGKSYKIAGSFVFADGENPTQIVYGYTVQLETEVDCRRFDRVIIDHIEEALGLEFNVLEGANDIGDHSKGAIGNSGNWHWAMIAFRLDEIGSTVFVRNTINVEPEIDVFNLARVYAKSIEQPNQYCTIVSAEADQTADIPTFKVEAEGFYPQERRYIKLDGPILIGDETKTATTIKAGLTGETSDTDGRISDVISFVLVLDEQGYENAQFSTEPNEYTLTVGGHSSGCEAVQTVVWP